MRSSFWSAFRSLPRRIDCMAGEGEHMKERSNHFNSHPAISLLSVHLHYDKTGARSVQRISYCTSIEATMPALRSFDRDCPALSITTKCNALRQANGRRSSQLQILIAHQDRFSASMQILHWAKKCPVSGLLPLHSAWERAARSKASANRRAPNDP